MSRITVEDCLKVVPNRFELIVFASQRTYAILCGAHTEIKTNTPCVKALREIAKGSVSVEKLKESLYAKFNSPSFLSVDAGISTDSFFSTSDFAFDEKIEDKSPVGKMFTDQNE